MVVVSVLECELDVLHTCLNRGGSIMVTMLTKRVDLPHYAVAVLATPAATVWNVFARRV